MEKYDVIVVGAGAAGLMAAGQAALSGAKTLLLEKKPLPGLKLRITGKGRCNVTNIAPIEDFIDHFGKNGRFLRQAFSRFFNNDLVAFFEELGVSMVTEHGGRVFPVSNEARHIVNALVVWVKNNGVRLKNRARVSQLLRADESICGVRCKEKLPGSGERFIEKDYISTAVIIATGGASYPATGSTGDGYHLAESVGHSIVPVRPALVPLETAGDIAPRLQGLSLQNVSASVWIDGKKIATAFGEMLFTHFGISGPIILSLSRTMVDALQAKQNVVVSIDLKPALDDQKLDTRLLRDLQTYSNRQYETLLKGLLPQKLIRIFIELTAIPAEKRGHQITKQERKQICKYLKDFRLSITGHLPLKEAIITAGGINLHEIDPRTMASRLVNGLYFAGEIMDIDADTGGYNLQAAFSTGWLAGQSAAKMINY